MDKEKKKQLERKGWKVGSVEVFLGLSAEETEYLELKLGLCRSLRERRKKQELTQTDLAEKLGTSQSRVAKMEAGDPAVSVDLLLRALFSLGATKQDVARIINSLKKPKAA